MINITESNARMQILDISWTIWVRDDKDRDTRKKERESGCFDQIKQHDMNIELNQQVDIAD